MANKYLSKVKIGSEYYYLKDADLRAIVNGFGTAVSKNFEETVTAAGTGLPTSAAVAAYVQSQIGSIHNFDIVLATDAASTPEGVSWMDGATPVVGTLAGSADTMFKLYLVPSGTSTRNVKDEYITIDNGADANPRYTWEKIGSTDVDLSGTLTDVKYEADSHKLSQKKGNGAYEEVHTFGALAEKDSASGTLADYATGITGAAYTPAGEVAVTLGEEEVASGVASIERAKYTPAGEISGTITPAGTVSATANNAGAFEVGGTNQSSAVTIDKTDATVYSITDVGEAPSFTEGAYTQGTFEKGTAIAANTDGSKLSATQEGEDEDFTLIVEAASTNQVMSYGATYTPGSKAADTFSAGKLPTKGAAQTVIGAINGATAAAQVFTGNKYDLAFQGTEMANGLSFAGTETDNVAISKVSYKKATVASQKFNGTEATITPTLEKGNKNVTVS